MIHQFPEKVTLRETYSTAVAVIIIFCVFVCVFVCLCVCVNVCLFMVVSERNGNYIIFYVYLLHTIKLFNCCDFKGPGVSTSCY